MRMRVAAKNAESKARVSQFLSFSQEQVPNLRVRDCLARIIALRLRGTITNCSLGIACMFGQTLYLTRCLSFLRALATLAFTVPLGTLKSLAVSRMLKPSTALS